MVLAENSFTITKSLFMEGMTRVLRECYGSSIKKAIMGLAAAWLVLAAATVFMKASVMYVAMEAVVLCLAAFWLWVMVPRSRAKRAYQKFVGVYGTDLARLTRFFDDRLVIDAAGTETVIPYSDIAQVMRSKRLLVLVTKERVGVMLKLDGFISGSDTSVTELINKARSEGTDNA